MRVLLGSGGFRTPDRIAHLTTQMRAFFGSVDRLLFVPYALADHDDYVRLLREKGFDAGYAIDGIHRHANPVRAVLEAPAIYVGGGNTFRLLAALQDHGLLEPIRQRVQAGVPFLGISAGCNVACPTIKTTNDMPITQPASLEALGLVPFQVNPHYYTGRTFIQRDDRLHEHFGETRDDRIREFHEMNDTPVIGLWEASLLCLQGRHLTLDGDARIFRKGQAPLDVTSGAELHDLLG